MHHGNRNGQTHLSQFALPIGVVRARFDTRQRGQMQGVQQARGHSYEGNQAEGNHGRAAGEIDDLNPVPSGRQKHFSF